MIQLGEYTSGLTRELYLFPGLDMATDLKQMKNGLIEIRKKLASFFKDRLSTIYLYSCGERNEQMIDLEQVYTHITWFSYMKKSAAHTESTELKNYKELFEKVIFRYFHSL